jgi:serine/threonine protein kinase, bacterial
MFNRQARGTSSFRIEVCLALASCLLFGCFTACGVDGSDSGDVGGSGGESAELGAGGRVDAGGESGGLGSGGEGEVGGAGGESGGDSASGEGGAAPAKYTLGGTISGLGSDGLVLANGTDRRTLDAGATTFTLPRTVAVGSAYEVVVLTQPSDHTCSIDNGSGTMDDADVTNISISCAAEHYTVSTLAGSESGLLDGSGTEARFAFPYGVAVDGSGNVYVADTANNAVRKVSADGTVSTLAATFGFPTGVAVNGGGIVYVADQNNLKIRAVSPDGVVSTALETPVVGLAIAADGTLYFADPASSLIRKGGPNGAVVTLAGSGLGGSDDGVGEAASFSGPQGVDVDGSGNVYVADTLNHAIRKITPEGIVSTFAGSGEAGNADGIGTAASLNFPGGLAVDERGNVFVADSDNHEIRKISPNGTVRTLAGTGAEGSADGAPAEASFLAPQGIAVDSHGNLFVADTENHRIRKLTRD